MDDEGRRCLQSLQKVADTAIPSLFTHLIVADNAKIQRKQGWNSSISHFL
jgi:hypothetical protein